MAEEFATVGKLLLVVPDVRFFCVRLQPVLLLFRPMLADVEYIVRVWLL